MGGYAPIRSHTEAPLSILDQITQQAGRLAGDVQQSVKRARIQGERRLLERQHRAALEELGERAYALVKDGSLDGAALSPQVAAVDSALMEIEGKDAEIAAFHDDAPAPPTPAPSPASAPDASAASRSAGTGWEAADRFFATKNDDD